MLDIRKRTGWIFFGAMMAQILLISAQVQTKSGVRALQAVTFEVFSRIEFGTASVVSGVRRVWGGYIGLRGAKAENEALRQRVAALEVQLQQEHALAMRSERLQMLLDMKTHGTVPTLAAEVIAGNPDPVMRTVTINRGSGDGVSADMAVIAPGGVVGRIIGPVVRHAARVQLLIDRNAAAGAMMERTRAGGMVVGVEANPPLRMELVSNLTDVKPGDAVVASGVDGIFPKGYLIGRVERVDRGTGLYRTISVRPGVEFSSLEEVLVVLSSPRPASRDEDVK
ncbi:MAG TPA: rod shape-determining protein MreC [Vicinamibacterales bacterium]|nr:rod shape-determining protein MreC [Vicinamibacterales bacterium]